ncbi:hypothetical protein B0J13DRAFT_532050 [Dactylonectria estremocensis]|uniref:Zn(2)-C6 fungal-type domain-containing protein n=1 Tax=Dactylonectria estremocensis TaxID=1079267 RepID=A0A9P9IIY9_9HYPO|nr:hypothetical protein B0J13DRAFT_532050 [Dactylonectria estremocensis]
MNIAKSHEMDQTLRGSTKPSSLEVRQPKKVARVLACVLCQQRKKKCDRSSPCSNCIKLKAVCIPSTPAPPRKRRRPNQELLERLARCEALLRHCTCLRPPLSQDTHFDKCSVVSSNDSPGAEQTSSPATDEASPL